MICQFTTVYKLTVCKWTVDKCTVCKFTVNKTAKEWIRTSGVRNDHSATQPLLARKILILSSFRTFLFYSCAKVMMMMLIALTHSAEGGGNSLQGKQVLLLLLQDD